VSTDQFMIKKRAPQASNATTASIGMLSLSQHCAADDEKDNDIATGLKRSRSMLQ